LAIRFCGDCIVIERIGCLSYVPLGYGTPQVQYMMRSLARHYETVMPIGLISPSWDTHAPQDDEFPDFAICHYSGDEHSATVNTALPELIRWINENAISRIGIYGAGEHTRLLLALWKALGGPPVTMLIESDEPIRRVVEGLPVVCVRALEPKALDLVVLSSALFEKSMAAIIARYRPEIPVVALYTPRLSRFGTELKPSEALSPTRISRDRDSLIPRWIDAFRPDLLVCTHFNLLASILDAKHKPEHIIYYVLEIGGTDGNRMTDECVDQHHALASRISLVLYPESNRMRRYQDIVGNHDVPSKVIFNTRPAAISHPRPADQRNGRVLIQGSLSADLTFIDYLTRRPEREPRIDVFGFAFDHDRAYNILHDSTLAQENGFSYGGLLSNQQLAELRPCYSYLVVMWNPISFDARYACPNKFFEAIADGVPPIAAPHPQCKEIIEKYDCGILLRDWSIEAFLEGLKQARDIYGTPRYQQLVDNCRLATTAELSWEHQFRSIVPALPPRRKLRHKVARRRLVLLDPTLRTEIGHHFHYAQHVLYGASRLGVQTVAGVSRDLEVHLTQAERIYPLYRHDFWGRDTSCREMPLAKDSSARFVAVTRQILDSERIEPGDDIFIPNISDSDLSTLTAFIEHHSADAFRWHIVLRHDLPAHSRVRIDCLRRLQATAHGTSIFFYADTLELADQHQRAADVPFTVLPIPVAATAMRKFRRKAMNERFRVTYLGDARTEKGYPLLPALVRACGDLVASGLLSFIIQANGTASDPACGLATAELEACDGVQLFRNHLSAAGYEELLRSADVVLALYDSDRYRLRSSHVVVEALCSGTPVLVRRGTASAALLPPDSPWLCDDVEEAAVALRRLVANSQGEWNRANKLRKSLAAFHNGKRLADILLRNIGAESSLRPLQTHLMEERPV
jgi:glycosyltransferase involved in cell wall biosynthesis